MKVLNLTDGDFDGVTAGVVTKALLDADVEFMDHSRNDLLCARVREFIASPTHDLLLITDICPTEEVFNELGVGVHAGAFQAQIIDHHPSASWLTNYGFDWTILDTTLCGAKLTYDWICKNGSPVDVPADLEDLVTLADVWDMWRLDDPRREEATKVNRLTFFLGQQRFWESALENAAFHRDDVYDMVSNRLREQEEEYVESVLTASFGEGTIVYHKGRDGVFCMVVATRHASAVAHTILDRSQADFVVVLNPQYNKIDFRSREGCVDVSEIAVRLGGGGHKAASGCPFNFREFMELLGRNLFT